MPSLRAPVDNSDDTLMMKIIRFSALVILVVVLGYYGGVMGKESGNKKLNWCGTAFSVFVPDCYGMLPFILL